MKLATLGLIVFIGTVVNGLPDSYASYATTPAQVYQKSEVSPKVNWAYWTNDGLLHLNQKHQKTDFTNVDCYLNKNIVFYDYKNINFGEDYVFDWTDNSEGQEFLVKLAQVKKRCPDVRVVFDPVIVWNQEIADQIVQKKVSISQLAKSITDFNTKYYTDGMVLTFMNEAVLNDMLTYDFLKELKRRFTHNKLQLILSYGPYKGLSYVRPVAFEFADFIMAYLDTYSSENRNSFQHPFPTYSEDSRSLVSTLEHFINMGADKSKLSILVSPYGFSFKRIDPSVSSNNETGLNCPAAGLGTVIYSDKTLIVESKNDIPFVHDLPTVCRVIADPEWTKKCDSDAQVPYAYNSNQWMGYDNEQSIKVKADLVKQIGIAGVTIFTLNSDDIYNRCGNGFYSFTRQFVKAFEY